MTTPDYTPKDTERFWSKVAITANDDLCWEWQASKDQNKYGQFWFKGKLIKASHFVFGITYNNFPIDLCVLHTCDNPTCVNPKHLFLGTHQDNADDKVSKNRQSKPKGIKNPNNKLSENQIIEIRHRYAQGGITERQLAKEYGVFFTLIHKIIKYERWKHI